MKKTINYKSQKKETEISYFRNFKLSFEENIPKVFIIDKLVYKLYRDKIREIISNDPVFLFEAEEENKNLFKIQTIYNFFRENKVNRSTMIIGIGGGITTDITAFAASTYMRGCRLILIPTTFLGMIDAAVGGKTAVNFRGIKNNIGTFYPAEKVIIIPEFLQTLPEKEMKNGWTECIKISLIKKSGLYDLLKTDKKINIDKIRSTLILKAGICENDPEDRGERRLLNLGHTFAHVLETASNYKISHGNAVAIGIRTAAKLSFKMGLISRCDFIKINDILNKYNLPKNLTLDLNSFNQQKISHIFLYDKKNSEGINVVLFSGFQETFICSEIRLEYIKKILFSFIKKGST